MFNIISHTVLNVKLSWNVFYKRSQNAKVFYELKEGIKIPLAKKVRGVLESVLLISKQ